MFIRIRGFVGTERRAYGSYVFNAAAEDDEGAIVFGESNARGGASDMVVHSDVGLDSDVLRDLGTVEVEGGDAVSYEQMRRQYSSLALSMMDEVDGGGTRRCR